MDVLAAKPEGMRAMRPVQLLISLEEVLRATKRDAIGRAGGQVTREPEKLAESRKQPLVGEIKGGSDRLLSQRLIAVSQAIEHDLGLGDYTRRERVSDVAKVVLVPCCLAGVESLIRAEADSAIGVRALFVHAANIDLGPIAQVVIEPVHGLPVIDRLARAEVRCPGGSDFTERGQVPRQAPECTAGGQPEIGQCLGDCVNGAVYRSD